MQITTRNDGANIVVDLDGRKVAAFDHIEGDLGHAQMRAEAYVQGLQEGLALSKEIPNEDLPDLPSYHPLAPPPPMKLFVWDSEAAGNGSQMGLVAAVAGDVDDARDKIHTAAATDKRDPAFKIYASELEHDLEAAPRIVEAIVYTP